MSEVNLLRAMRDEAIRQARTALDRDTRRWHATVARILSRNAVRALKVSP
jgi:hypothetical protein